MSDMAQQRIKREFKEVIKSEEVFMKINLTLIPCKFKAIYTVLPHVHDCFNIDRVITIVTLFIFI